MYNTDGLKNLAMAMIWEAVHIAQTRQEKDPAESRDALDWLATRQRHAPWLGLLGLHDDFVLDVARRLQKGERINTTKNGFKVVIEGYRGSPGPEQRKRYKEAQRQQQKQQNVTTSA